jgi:hypothetical protein
MSVRRFLCGLALALGTTAATASPSVATTSCARAYSYAGFDSAWSADGVGATITALSDPVVAAGHVAAWVGVGGVGAGPRGTNEWLQVGVAGFEAAVGAGNELYYEVALPNQAPVYHRLGRVATMAPVRVSVLETAQRRGWWRVWVNGRPATAPIHLAASHGTWQPQVTTESWNGGTGACNRFSYRFAGVAIARGAGGSWRGLTRGSRYVDPGYGVQGRSPSRFLAASAS